MTCRCVMCGAKNAGRLGRGSYVRADVRCYEYITPGERKQQRRQRRRAEREQWAKEEW